MEGAATKRPRDFVIKGADMLRHGREIRIIGSFQTVSERPCALGSFAGRGGAAYHDLPWSLVISCRVVSSLI
jgi:hypothetical protein